jgi:hypothetical protein
LATAIALPVSFSTFRLAPQHETLLLYALSVTMPPLTILPNQVPGVKSVRDEGPPPRDLLTNDCVLLI